MNHIKKIFDLNAPAWTLIVIGICAFLAGSHFGAPESNGKVATIARNMLIFEAVQARAGQSEEQLQKEVVQPINAFIKSYQDEGYLVVDTSIDAEGHMAILALPNGSVDVSNELAKVLAPKAKTPSAQ